MKKQLAIWAMAALVLATFASTARAVDFCTRKVSTTEGQVLGRAETDNASCVWKGIPFAAPPVGDLRFRATQPAGRTAVCSTPTNSARSARKSRACFPAVKALPTARTA